MERTLVKSSQIASLGYDPKTQKLHVEFNHSGAIYEYDNVSPERFEAFKNAESVGRFFGTYIRGNPEHPFRKLEAGNAQAKKAEA